MKKIFAAVVFVFSVLVLIACSNQESLDGEYYWIEDGRNDHILTIKGEKGYLDSEGGHSLTVDKDLNTFEISGFMNPTVKYEYKDGVLTANLTGVKRDFYKKDSEAYKKALKKEEKIQKEKENQEKANKKRAEQMAQSDEVQTFISQMTEKVKESGNTDIQPETREYVGSYISFDGEDYNLFSLYNVTYTTGANSVTSETKTEEYKAVYGFRGIKEEKGKLDLPNVDNVKRVNDIYTSGYDSYQDYFLANDYVEVNSKKD